jgi:hypothetical protein
MSKLIIKDRISALRKGYPTVSDKYNVQGGIVVDGGVPVKVGELVKFSTTPGYYEGATTLANVNEVAGLALSTNVRLTRVWPSDSVTPVTYEEGEAFDLFLDGFIAVEMDDAVIMSTLPMIAAVGALSTDTAVVPGKDYYTRASNTDGAGFLNDGTFKYTLVASPTGNPSTSNYYELSEVGQDAATNQVTPNKQAAVILATGKITTADYVTTGVVLLPGYRFTGLIDGRLAELQVK